jgi:mRNA-degrading endonuclease toxin of MazEF toxin-antitoxin module
VEKSGGWILACLSARSPAIDDLLEWAAAPGNVSFRARDTGLKHRSAANVSQLTVADRVCLKEKVGRIPGTVMARLDEGIKLALGLV